MVILAGIAVTTSRSVRSVGINFPTNAPNVIGNAIKIVISALSVTTGLKITATVRSATIKLNMIGVVNFFLRPRRLFFLYRKLTQKYAPVTERDY